MLSIQSIIKEHNDLWRSLLHKSCVVSESNKVLYSGILSDSAISRYIGNSRVILEVNISNDKNALFTFADIPSEVYEHTISEMMEDASLYNKMMNLSSSLPVVPGVIDESLPYGIAKIKLIQEAELDSDSDGDPNSAPLGTEGAQEDADAKMKSDVQFKVWVSPDKQVDWISDNEKYLKIEYVYDDKKKGITIDFLLGKKDGTWQLYAGKKGTVSYDDDPMKDLKKKNFKDGILSAIEYVADFIKKVEDNPDDWTQFYIHL